MVGGERLLQLSSITDTQRKERILELRAHYLNELRKTTLHVIINESLMQSKEKIAFIVRPALPPRENTEPEGGNGNYSDSYCTVCSPHRTCTEGLPLSNGTDNRDRERCRSMRRVMCSCRRRYLFCGTAG